MTPLTAKQQRLVDSIRIDIQTEIPVSADNQRPITIWHATARAYDWDSDDMEPPATVVARMRLVRCDLMSADVLDALDEQTGDLEMIGSTLLEDDDLHPELELAGFGGDLLIVDNVRVADDWRGYGVGTLLLGMVIKTLGDGCSAAALYPSPIDRDPSSLTQGELDALRAKIGNVYAQIGFDHWRDNVWVLDLALVSLDEGVAQLRKELGLT